MHKAVILEGQEWNLIMVDVSAKKLPSNEQRTAIVVGGGPTGTLIALYLARIGWKVSVHERRSMDAKVSSNRRSFNIVLNERGLKALKEVGVQLPSEKKVFIKGNIRHTAKRATSGRGFRNSVSIDRYTLAQFLISEGKHRYSDKIKYNFDQELIRINIQDKIAFFKTKSDDIEKNFDLLIGADGVFSKVRASMESQLEEFEVHQKEDNMMYKIIDLGLAENLPGATKEWASKFHTWPGTQPVTLLAPPTIDGSLNGILILPKEGEFTYDKVQTEQNILDLFKNKFSDIFPNLDEASLPQNIVDDLLSQKASCGGITTICSQLVGSDCIVLLGDAAHSVWPSLGQGCNSALESCRVFAQVLEKNSGDLSTALPDFNKIRKPDVDAIARLSEIGFGGNKRATSTLFIMKVSVLLLLHKILPKWFHKYALFQINDAEVPYSRIWQQVEIQDRQFFIALVALASTILIFWIATLMTG